MPDGNTQNESGESTPDDDRLIRDSTLEDRRGYSVFDQAIDPFTGKKWDIRISHERRDIVVKRGAGHARELAYCVTETLESPKRIYQGIREEDEREWLCYCGKPEYRYHGVSGDQRVADAYEVFLVFVNADRVAYNWRWEKCDEEDALSPMDSESRFEKRVL